MNYRIGLRYAVCDVVKVQYLQNITDSAVTWAFADKQMAIEAGQRSRHHRIYDTDRELRQTCHTLYTFGYSKLNKDCELFVEQREDNGPWMPWTNPSK